MPNAKPSRHPKFNIMKRFVKRSIMLFRNQRPA